MKALLLVLVLASCTQKNPLFCERDEDCADSERPFCDLNGEFEESDGIRNICIPTPPDCPLERCGCTPGESLACDLDQLTVCAEDGFSTEQRTCALGCSTEDRCLAFEPSNGLGPALEMAALEQDLVLPDGAIIDTQTGTITDAGGNSITVTSVMVPQPDSVAIRAFIARSIEITNARVRGGAALAIVAARTIRLDGILRARASGTQSGPGGQEVPAPCVGASTGSLTIVGAGGGGNATSGGSGGNNEQPGRPGGAGIVVFSPLAGGCRGGALNDSAGTAVVSQGGGGGGAVQLVAGEGILFASAALIDVGAGGGERSAGGGSGGVLLAEAPRIEFAGSTTGIAANGGAGGGKTTIGADALASGLPAVGTNEGGSGGTGTANPASGSVCIPQGMQFCVIERKGGGGGAAGRIKLATNPGGLIITGTPLLSGALTTTTLVLQ